MILFVNMVMNLQILAKMKASLSNTQARITVFFIILTLTKLRLFARRWNVKESSTIMISQAFGFQKSLNSVIGLF